MVYQIGKKGNDMTAVLACKLRPHNKRLSDDMQKVPNNRPGWYRWWAPKAALEPLLNSRHISKKYMDEFLQRLQRRKYKQDTYYCIYVGVAVKGSIRSRLNWHVNQDHTESAVQNKALSTLRQSISSLVAGDQYDKKATDKLIDQLLIEYCAIDDPIKSEKAKKRIEQIESDEVKNNLLPLNIKGNKQKILKPFLHDLTKARGKARNK